MRAASDSLMPDLQSLGISMQQSMLANSYCSHPMSVLHSSAPAVSTAGMHWSGGYSAAGNLSSSGCMPVLRASAPTISTAGWSSGYSAVGNLPASGHSWMSQTLSARQPDTRRHAAASQLPRPTAARPTEVEHLGLAASEVPDSKLAAVCATESGEDDDREYDDDKDENSELSLSVNRLVGCLSHLCF